MRVVKGREGNGTMTDGTMTDGVATGDGGRTQAGAREEAGGGGGGGDPGPTGTDDGDDPRPLTDEELAMCDDAMKGVYVLRPSNVRADRLLRDAVRLVRANQRPTVPAGTLRDGTALVVYGPPRAGKSSLVERMLSRQPSLAGKGDGQGLPMVSLQVKGPATLRSVGLQLLDGLEYAIRGRLDEMEVWRLVYDQIRRRGTLVIHLGEITHLAKVRKGDGEGSEGKKLRDVLKSLIINEQHPVVLVMSGLPVIATFLTEDKAIEDRSSFVRVEDLQDEDVDVLADGVRRVAAEVGLAVDEDDLVAELVPRLMHVARDQLGRAMEYAVAAARRALAPEDDDGDRLPPDVRLERLHFADHFALTTGNADWANCFLTDKWREIDPSAKGLTSRSQRDDGGAA